MGQALGSVLPLAVAIAIFPVPIIAVVLMIGSDRGKTKGLAFVLAWCLGLGAVGAVVLAFAGIVDRDDGADGSETWVSAVLLGLGLLALGAAVKQWRGRPRGGQESPVPGWMRMVDGFTVAKAGAAGFALSALNPKNLLLAVAAAAEIVEAELPADQQVAVLLVFVLIASAGVLTPLVLSLVLGDRSRELLNGLRSWMTRQSAVIMSVLLLLIGAKLIGDAVSGFSS